MSFGIIASEQRFPTKSLGTGEMDWTLKLDRVSVLAFDFGMTELRRKFGGQETQEYLNF